MRTACRGPHLPIVRAGIVHGWLGEEEKRRILVGSRGLIFPVRWREPFGLAIVESSLLRLPRLRTPYGRCRSSCRPTWAFLSSDAEELALAVRGAARFDPRRCHADAVSGFGVRAMTDAYLEAYERVRTGEHLHAGPPRRTQPLERELLPFT